MQKFCTVLTYQVQSQSENSRTPFQAEMQNFVLKICQKITSFFYYIVDGDTNAFHLPSVTMFTMCSIVDSNFFTHKSQSHDERIPAG